MAGNSWSVIKKVTSAVRMKVAVRKPDGRITQQEAKIHEGSSLSLQQAKTRVNYRIFFYLESILTLFYVNIPHVQH